MGEGRSTMTSSDAETDSKPIITLPHRTKPRRLQTMSAVLDHSTHLSRTDLQPSTYISANADGC